MGALIYLYYSRLPEPVPGPEVTMVVGKVVYRIEDDGESGYQGKGFEISFRSSRRGNFTVETDVNGFFSFPVWVGSEVWFKEINLVDDNIPTSDIGYARLYESFQTEAAGVSNVGTLIWNNAGFLKSGIYFHYDYSLANKVEYSYTHPDSPWVHEPWHKIQVKGIRMPRYSRYF